MKKNNKFFEIKEKKGNEWTDEEDYMCSLMGWIVANAGDDITTKYLDHRNRRSFKFSLERIDEYLDKSGWWKYGKNKYWDPLYHDNEDNWKKLEIENEKKIKKKYNFVPPAPKGFMHRWIRAEITKNIQHKLTTAGNWTLVRADQYPDSEYPVVDSGKYAGVIGVGGLLLARMSKEIVKPKRIKDVKNEKK